MSGMQPVDKHIPTFYLSLLNEQDWLHYKKNTAPRHSLFLAVLASLLIHLLFLQWKFSAQDALPIQRTTKTIQINLNYVAKPELPRVTEVMSEPDIAVAPLAKVKQDSHQHDEKTVVSDVVPIKQIDRIVDKQQKDTVEPMVREQNNFEQNSTHFNDVFDPRLRARLQDNSAYRASQSASDNTNVTDLHGNTIVELDSGSCMRSTQSAVGQPTNWYITTCSGAKNESEQMIDRINDEVRRRRKATK